MRAAIRLLAMMILGATAAVAADDNATLAELDAKCEQAREAKLKPLREAEIARCKADDRNDPGYCERFWKGYGSAFRRANGTVQPRMFDDLPECVAAHAARRTARDK